MPAEDEFFITSGAKRGERFTSATFCKFLVFTQKVTTYIADHKK